jgi:hypothetical protein
VLIPALLHVERHAQKVRENVDRELAGGDDFVFWQLDSVDWLDLQARVAAELAKYRCPRGTRSVANLVCRRQDERAIWFMIDMSYAVSAVYSSKWIDRV